MSEKISPVDVFRADRQFERFMLKNRERCNVPYDSSQDEVIATIVYDPDKQTVTVVQRSPPSEPPKTT
jgi:hypothetical protein